MKHLLRIDDFTAKEVEDLFVRARVMKDKKKRGVDHRSLKGKVLALVFDKDSTRTRVSFEVGIYDLGGLPIYLNVHDLQVGRGETIADTGRVLSRYIDAVVIRTYSQQDVEELAKHSEVPVINGLTDLYHPCQVLTDLFTIEEMRGSYRDATIVYIGDGNNMANSWIRAALLLGLNLRLSCPKGYRPLDELLEEIRSGSHAISLVEDPREAAEGADVLYTDVWVSMGQEEEREEKEKAFEGYQINKGILSKAKDDCLVMHCLPAHRGEEITGEVIDGPQSVVFDQAENRLHVQKAILEMLIKGDGSKRGRIKG
jgi:ornithine carbamoyltransferase